MGYLMTPREAFLLMKESEKHGGHPCTRHIGLSNAQLMRRLYDGEGARNGGIQYISTFTNDSDAGRAASQTFKNIEGGLRIDNYKPQKKRYESNLPEIRVDEAYKVRFALGSGVREFYVNHMMLVLFRPEEPAPNRFYVLTFYPRPPNELRSNRAPGIRERELMRVPAVREVRSIPTK